MGLGKKYSLKIEKQHETTPGPKYKTEKVKSFECYISHLKNKP